MRRLGLGLLIIISSMTPILSAQAANWISRVSVGPEYHIASGDTDDRFGAYACYELDLADPVQAILGVDYFAGDYHVGDAAGSFSTVGLELVFVAHREWGIWDPYIGAGAGHYMNDVDNYEDNIGMLLVVGTRLRVNDRFSAELGVRRLSLKPDHEIRQNGRLNMDAVVVRAGVVFNF